MSEMVPAAAAAAAVIVVARATTALTNTFLISCLLHFVHCRLSCRTLLLGGMHCFCSDRLDRIIIKEYFVV